MYSSSLRASGVIEEFPVSFSDFEEVDASYSRALDEIHLATEQIFEPEQQAEVPLGRSLPTEIFEVDEEVEVAARRV